ncbi:jacalin-related lectin 2-like [Chenopodium quinoa]|uniref:jacalin-related lectin 2-like n=1 Tax=Chenopodium quinoa TaxID=63459 RepID=UPI000B797820|nr:jacalin-related lectin 2-like [Chenopodium quinoa]
MGYQDGVTPGISPLYGEYDSPAPIFTTVTLDGPSEYITGLKGNLYDYHNCSDKWISSLTIETNKNSYGPSGKPNAGEKEFKNQFGGFHGTFGNPGFISTRLTSIGVYVKPT